MAGGAAGNGGGPDAFGRNDSNRGSQSDYPAAEVETVPVARARLATARAEQEQMLNDLHAVVDRLNEDFNDSPDMVAATRDEKQAYNAYDEARRHVLEKLSEDPSYRAMISLVVSLKDQLEAERPAKPTTADAERLMATATLKLSYASAASAMEAAALAADSDVQQARNRLVSAGARRSDLASDFARRVRRDPAFLAARRSLDDARIAHLTADAFYEAAVDARTIALDYAYYLHRFDQYSYSPALGYGGLYPWGYGGPYYGRRY